MKKSILVPYEKYMVLVSQQQHQNSANNSSAALENNKLNPTTTTEPEPQRVLLVAEEEEEQQKQKQKQAQATGSNNEPRRLTSDVILSYLPKNIQRKSNALLCEIEKSADIDWNDSGLVIIDSQPTSSHICDLLHFANCSNKREPQGARALFSKLAHLPATLISNPKARIQHGGIPPGIPNKEPKSSMTSWRRMWKPL